MAFGNTGYAIHSLRDDASAPSANMVGYLTAQARIPWIFTPFSAQTAAQDSAAYDVLGRDSTTLVTYAPGTAPASFSLQVWGSMTNNPNSFSLLATISTLTATTVTGPYRYLVFSLQSIATPGGGLTVEVASFSS